MRVRDIHNCQCVMGGVAAAKTREAIKVGLVDATQLIFSFNENAAKRSHPTIYVLVEKIPHEHFDFIKKHLQQKFDCYCLCEMQCKTGTGDYDALWCDMHMIRHCSCAAGTPCRTARATTAPGWRV